jgi:hypothetical protein
MRSATIIRKIYQAFATRTYPGDHNIVHCEHDRRWGGTLPGPCRECAEVVAEFKGKGNKGLNVKGLSWVSFGLVSMTEQAFPFWLPSYLAAAVRTPDYSHNIFDGLHFRFRPPREEKERIWQESRIPLLSQAELEGVIDAFRHMHEQRKYDASEVSELVEHLSRWRRPSAS